MFWLEIQLRVTTNTAGYCPHVSFKVSSVVTFQKFGTPRSLIKCIRRCHTYMFECSLQLKSPPWQLSRTAGPPPLLP